MIASSNTSLSLELVVENHPTKTYRMDYDTMRIAGMTDGLEAMRQAILKILSTERYENLIYSWDYGVEFEELIGAPKALAYPEIKRRITEALTQDDRVLCVEAFSFEDFKNKVNVSFVVKTSVGDVEIGKEVTL